MKFKKKLKKKLKKIQFALTFKIVVNAN
jgi:hypothetical protein